MFGDGPASDVLSAVLAIVLGIAGSYALYWGLDKLLNLLPGKWPHRLRVLGFTVPALALVTLVLILPFIQTIAWSFMKIGAIQQTFVGFDNYVSLFQDGDFWSTVINNFLWIAFVPAITVIAGLTFATLGNNVGPRREKVFKSLIFMPMAISFVAASSMWRFAYSYASPGRPEVGIFNSIAKWMHDALGIGPGSQPLLTNDTWRLNSFLLMIVLIWAQAGYSMVLLSAGIKAVPEETIEAARVDGASAAQVFFRIVVPQMSGTIMSVFITVLIGTMKVFDIVLGMTGGNFNTNVLALDFYQKFIVQGDLGGASAIVIILCLLVAPMVWVQIRTIRHQESLR